MNKHNHQLHQVSRPDLTLIAAVSEDGFISSGKGVPWHLPADITHFRKHTTGKWLLLGRRTFDEMRGWFRPGHKPLILSRDEAFKPEIGQRVSSVEEALSLVDGELMVCGGGQVYHAAMPHSSRLMVTRVHTKLGSGVPFPTIDETYWQEIHQIEHAADAAHAFAMTFLSYRRR